MDRQPLARERTKGDQRFSSDAIGWDDAAEQIQAMTEQDTSSEQVAAAMELVGVWLRSCSRDDLDNMFALLDIDLPSMFGKGGSTTANNVQVLMAHEHAGFDRTTEEVSDALQSWRVKCRDCGEERRVTRG
jgi:hypothetical protein